MTPIEVIEEARYIAVTEQQIRQIQLDALKEGMRRAASVVITLTHDDCYNGSRYSIPEKCKQAILSAAEQLTEKDL